MFALAAASSTSSSAAVNATVDTSSLTTKLLTLPPVARRTLFSTFGHREAKALPVGSEVPVAIVDRVDLERLGHERDIELHAHRGRVSLARMHLIALDHVPRRDVLDDGERVRQRRKAELETAARHAIFARERLEREANALRDAHGLLVEPVPARAREFEIGGEVERDALVDRVFQAAVEIEIEAGVEAPAGAVGLQRGALHRDRIGARRRGGHEAKEQRDPEQGREAQREEAFDGHRFWKRA
ncbi:exported hypothetical protein [Paraburkholderia tropica]